MVFEKNLCISDDEPDEQDLPSQSWKNKNTDNGNHLNKHLSATGKVVDYSKSLSFFNHNPGERKAWCETKKTLDPCTIFRRNSDEENRVPGNPRKLFPKSKPSIPLNDHASKIKDVLLAGISKKKSEVFEQQGGNKISKRKSVCPPVISHKTIAGARRDYLKNTESKVHRDMWHENRTELSSHSSSKHTSGKNSRSRIEDKISFKAERDEKNRPEAYVSPTKLRDRTISFLRETEVTDEMVRRHKEKRPKAYSSSVHADDQSRMKMKSFPSKTKHNEEKKLKEAPFTPIRTRSRSRSVSRARMRDEKIVRSNVSSSSLSSFNLSRSKSISKVEDKKSPAAPKRDKRKRMELPLSPIRTRSRSRSMSRGRLDSTKNSEKKVHRDEEGPQRIHSPPSCDESPARKVSQLRPENNRSPQSVVIRELRVISAAHIRSRSRSTSLVKVDSVKIRQKRQSCPEVYSSSSGSHSLSISGSRTRTKEADNPQLKVACSPPRTHSWSSSMSQSPHIKNSPKNSRKDEKCSQACSQSRNVSVSSADTLTESSPKQKIDQETHDDHSSHKRRRSTILEDVEHSKCKVQRLEERDPKIQSSSVSTIERSRSKSRIKNAEKRRSRSKSKSAKRHKSNDKRSSVSAVASPKYSAHSDEEVRMNFRRQSISNRQSSMTIRVNEVKCRRLFYELFGSDDEVDPEDQDERQPPTALTIVAKENHELHQENSSTPAPNNNASPRPWEKRVIEQHATSEVKNLSQNSILPPDELTHRKTQSNLNESGHMSYAEPSSIFSVESRIIDPDLSARLNQFRSEINLQRELKLATVQNNCEFNNSALSGSDEDMTAPEEWDLRSDDDDDTDTVIFIGFHPSGTDSNIDLPPQTSNTAITPEFSSELENLSKLIRILQNQHGVIRTIKDNMEKMPHLADGFKQPLSSASKEYHRIIGAHSPTIMQKYDGLIKVQNASVISDLISKKNNISVEEVESIISRCMLSEDCWSNIAQNQQPESVGCNNLGEQHPPNSKFSDSSRILTTPDLTSVVEEFSASTVADLEKDIEDLFFRIGDASTNPGSNCDRFVGNTDTGTSTQNSHCPELAEVSKTNGYSANEVNARLIPITSNSNVAIVTTAPTVVPSTPGYANVPITVRNMAPMQYLWSPSSNPSVPRNFQPYTESNASAGLPRGPTSPLQGSMPPNMNQYHTTPSNINHYNTRLPNVTYNNCTQSWPYGNSEPPQAITQSQTCRMHPPYSRGVPTQRQNINLQNRIALPLTKNTAHPAPFAMHQRQSWMRSSPYGDFHSRLPNTRAPRPIPVQNPTAHENLHSIVLSPSSLPIYRNNAQSLHDISPHITKMSRMVSTHLPQKPPPKPLRRKSKNKETRAPNAEKVMTTIVESARQDNEPAQNFPPTDTWDPETPVRLQLVGNHFQAAEALTENRHSHDNRTLNEIKRSSESPKPTACEQPAEGQKLITIIIEDEDEDEEEAEEDNRLYLCAQADCFLEAKLVCHCETVVYCSVECRIVDWKRGHKEKCRKLKEIKSPSDPP